MLQNNRKNRLREKRKNVFYLNSSMQFVQLHEVQTFFHFHGLIISYDQ